MAIDPTGHFLYVGTNGGILLYDTGTSGTLTRDTTVLLSDIYPFALQVDSTGHWLLDASNTQANQLSYAWPISIINGESTLGSNISVPSQYLISGGSVGRVGWLYLQTTNWFPLLPVRRPRHSALRLAPTTRAQRIRSVRLLIIEQP